MNSVSIITVNFNQHQVNIDFLKSIKAYPSSSKVEVILVDNGSREQYEQEYKQILPELIYIRSEENLGFAGGNNLGIKKATGKYLLLLNNDIEITAN
ncbi:MAG: glycosyltransferase, partial [Pedobacter sp.]